MLWSKCQSLIVGMSLILLLSPSAEAQNSWIVATRAHWGFIIAHSKELPNVQKTHPWGVELEWNWQLMKEDAWNYCYCYPRTGASFLFINFDKPDILGRAYASYLFIEPVLGAQKKFHLSFRFGIGPAFLDRIYDEQTNPENTFFSTTLSFIVTLNAAMNFRIAERTNLQFAGFYNHISNGGIKNPNKGINFPTLSLGVDYNLRPVPYTQHLKKDSSSLQPYKWRFDVVAFGAAKTDIKGHEHYLVYGLMPSVSRVIGRMSAISLALEGTVDLADKKEIERNNIEEDGRLVDHKYFAALLGHELLIGRFNFSIHFGAYLYSPFKRRNLIYERYGLTYRVFRNIFFGTNIKAHGHVADFLDFRLGVSF
jgi:hypothetical protein